MSRRQPAFMYVAIDKIDPGINVRLEGDVAQLARSIEQHGILQPITVVPTSNGERVECVFGHRRLAAARKAGLKSIPCLLRPRDPEEIRVLTQLAENRDRRDMTKLEEALVYQSLRKLGMTQTQIANAVGTDQSSVSQRLILLKYPNCVQQAVHHKMIGLSDALAIPLELANDTDPRTLAAACRRGGRNLRNWVARELGERATPLKKRKVFSSFNLEAGLVDEISRAAQEAGVTIMEWATPILREALDAQIRARVAEAHA